MSGAPISGDYIKAEGQAGRMRARMTAIVAVGQRGRVYLPPTAEMQDIVRDAKPEWKPDVVISGSTQYLGVKPYGMQLFSQLFNERQLVALTTLSDLVVEVRGRVREAALAAGLAPDDRGLDEGGNGANAYADAIALYLGLAVSRQVNRLATLNFWGLPDEKVQQVFARQALSMTWDYVEANPFSQSSGNFVGQLGYLTNVITALPLGRAGRAVQADATTQDLGWDKIISTDPPYFDNVPYGDLSDFFYVWLRRSLRPLFPSLFATVAVPKVSELVAFAHRHRDKEAAGDFFMDGMGKAMHRLAEQSHPSFPVTIYYAFRQSETNSDDGTSSTGWETFLGAVIRAGFCITGTWPIRTEYTSNLKTKRSALASSIVLVCRPRSPSATTVTRRDFINELKAELPTALILLQRGNIAPVDLAQSAIGPGMAVYTRYAKVIDAQGAALSVREALALINQVLDEVLSEQEGDFDADSRWALSWFDQFGYAEGEFGVAETLSKAKNTSIGGLIDAGVISSRARKLRLLLPSELSPDWDPTVAPRLTAWEIVHHLIRSLEENGETAAAEVVVKLGSKAAIARELAYRLYAISERKKRAREALSYNGLVQSWPEITRLAGEVGMSRPSQTRMFEQV